MNCPQCRNVALREEPSGDVAIERCLTCHGIWLDANELERVLANNPKPILQDDARFTPTPHAPGPRRNCPRCRGTYLIKLNSRLHPGTIIDNCTVCYGTWLDAGELSRLANPDLLTRLRALF